MGYVRDYLDGLPAGIDSYPDQRAKASAYRAFLEGLPAGDLAGALPAPVRHLVTDPEPVTAWITEVHANVLYLAAVDVLFDGEADFLDHYERMNERLLGGPLYRMLMRVASPGIIVRGAAARWDSFHRGVTLEAEGTGPNAAKVTLTWPPAIYTRLIAEGYARAFVVALRLAGGKDAALELTEFTATGARYRGTWG